MKSIGIITYHRSHNHGSALQAYALNYYLRSMGFDAYTIDYRTQKQADIYKIFEPYRSLMSAVRNLQSIIYYSDLIDRKKNFDYYIESRLPITQNTYKSAEELKAANLNFDYYICGSDQIWNPNCIDFDETYLLSFVSEKSKCISYAASVAADKIDKRWHKKFRDELLKYKALSVREELGANIISEIVGREVETVLDPVFLLSENDWNVSIKPTIINRGPYILCYFIGNINGMREYAIKMHKKLKMPLVVIYKNIRDMLYNNIKMYNAGPEQFISLLKNSEYVCTNSFHAVAFSIIFGKKFWAFVDMNNPLSAKSRILNLTDKFGLQNRVINSSRIKTDITEKIDYKNVRIKLDEEINKSQMFLSLALK